VQAYVVLASRIIVSKTEANPEEETVEGELLSEEIDEDLDDPDLEPNLAGEFEDDAAPVAEADDEEEAAPAARKVEADDDDEEDEDDVEADLDAILKDRLSTPDDDNEEDEEPPVPSDPNSVAAKRDGEFVCGNCYMLVSAAAPTCPMGDGYELCAPIA
jgi:hypothetical protein